MSPIFPPKLANHLAESVREARHRYRKRLARCQKKFSEKAVHNLRTETRRILALLSLIDGFHIKKSPKKLCKTFKKRLDAFDDLRDTHVQRVLLKPMWPAFPEAKDFNKHLCKCEKRLEGQMSRKIKKTKHGSLNRRLKELEKCLCKCAEHPPNGRSGAVAQEVLGNAFRRVMVLRRQIKRNDPSTIHHMRVAFKKFRYTAELLQPFSPKFTEERLARIKNFQSTAGDIQDVAVLLKRLNKDIEDGCLEPACIDTLRGELVKRERLAIDSFMKRINDLMDFEPEPPAPLVL